MNSSLLRYELDNKIEAFTTRIGSDLPYPVIQPHQIHSNSVMVVDRRGMTRNDLEGVDALITSLEDCAIGVRTADCVPILIFDPINKTIAAVHSGWRGTVLRIVQKTIHEMERHFNTIPERLKVVIGPSIGPDSFIVHKDVVDEFKNSGFPEGIISEKSNQGEYVIDLWKANEELLKEIGVLPQNIQVVGLCTFIHHDEFYSARYEKNNKCGRNINVIRIIHK